VRVSEAQYLIGGWSISPLGYDKLEKPYGLQDMWLVSIDGSGQFQWGDVIGCTDEEAITALYAYPDSSVLVAGYSASDTCGDKNELNMTGGDNAPDYFLFRLDPYQFTQVFDSDLGCVNETYLLPWGEETDTFGVFADTSYGEIVDTIHLFELEPVLIEDSIVDYTSFADLYYCDPEAEYTWIDCVTGEPVDWADDCYFYVYEDGYYGVVIEKEGCVDTSECLLLFAAAVANPYLPDVHIFPNPGNGSIQIAGAPIGSFLEIRDLYGQIIYTTSVEKPELLIDISENRAGMYQIRLTYKGKQADVRYVKVQ